MMNHQDATAPKFFSLLSKPWVDRAIAVLALAPFFYLMYDMLKAGILSFPHVTAIIQFVMIVITMLIRRPAVRITTNPYYWALAFVATYGGLFTVALYDKGKQLAPLFVIYGIDILALIVTFWARVSLGRNIGIVPAERRIVTSGAYAYMRHPIYTGVFLSFIALQLTYFSLSNLLLDLFACGLWVLKTLVEERFLSQNPEYAAYMKKVRWRWFPGIA